MFRTILTILHSLHGTIGELPGFELSSQQFNQESNSETGVGRVRTGL